MTTLSDIPICNNYIFLHIILCILAILYDYTYYIKKYFVFKL